MEVAHATAKRAFLYLFLLTFIYFGVAGKEAWPMTGWRLFSSARTDHQASWEVEYVDTEGRSDRVPFERMSWAYRGFPQILRGFPNLSQEERLGVCSAWMTALEDMSIRPTRLEIHRTTWRLSDRDGLRARSADKVLAFTCTHHQIQEL